MRNWPQLALVLVVAPLVGGWDWFGKYGSRLEASQACKAWVAAGATRKIEQVQFRTRWKRASIPGEWSEWRDAKSAQFIPSTTPGEDVEKRTLGYFVDARSCIAERDTNQLLGMENGQVQKRFKY